MQMFSFYFWMLGQGGKLWYFLFLNLFRESPTITDVETSTTDDKILREKFITLVGASTVSIDLFALLLWNKFFVKNNLLSILSQPMSSILVIICVSKINF